MHIGILEKRCEIEKSQWRGIQSKEARARKLVLSVARFFFNLKNREQLHAWLLRFGFFVLCLIRLLRSTSFRLPLLLLSASGKSPLFLRNPCGFSLIFRLVGSQRISKESVLTSKTDIF